MISFSEVSRKEDLLQIEQLASVIWREHYTPIIGKNQVDYMLRKFQSVEAMADQIKRGYHYFRIDHNNELVGYLSFEKRGSELFLSKIYLLREQRGKGIGKSALGFVLNNARSLQCKKVALTVNKFNLNAIKAYERAGYVNAGPIVQDIGQGYFMDDFLMEKVVDHE